jgi:hypothetical protein
MWEWRYSSTIVGPGSRCRSVLSPCHFIPNLYQTICIYVFALFLETAIAQYGVQATGLTIEGSSLDSCPDRLWH